MLKGIIINQSSPRPPLRASLSRKSRGHGFTLIEILIVMVILSIVSGIAALTLSHNQQKQFEYLANSLAHTLTLAEEEAMLRPAILGLAFTPDRFQFFVFHPKVANNAAHWQALTDAIFGLHPIAKNIAITLLVQHKKAALDGKPQIIISTSGDITPFTILLGKKESLPSYQVTGYTNGSISSKVFHEK